MLNLVGPVQAFSLMRSVHLDFAVRVDFTNHRFGRITTAGFGLEWETRPKPVESEVRLEFCFRLRFGRQSDPHISPRRSGGQAPQPCQPSKGEMPQIGGPLGGFGARAANVSRHVAK